MNENQTRRDSNGSNFLFCSICSFSPKNKIFDSFSECLQHLTINLMKSELKYNLFIISVPIVKRVILVLKKKK